MCKLRSKKCRKKIQEMLWLAKNNALMGIIMVQKPDNYDNGSKNDNDTVFTTKEDSARAELEKKTCEQYRKMIKQIPTLIYQYIVQFLVILQMK